MSSLKSAWPGVSSRFICSPRYGNCRTLVVIEMPRSRSISIQSLTALARPRFAFTAPASWMAPP